MAASAVGAVAINQGLLRPGDAFYAQLGNNPAEALVALLRFIARCAGGVFNAPFNQGIIERALEQHLGGVPGFDWIDLMALDAQPLPRTQRRPARMDICLAAFGIERPDQRSALRSLRPWPSCIRSPWPAPAASETSPPRGISLEPEQPQRLRGGLTALAPAATPTRHPEPQLWSDFSPTPRAQMQHRMADRSQTYGPRGARLAGSPPPAISANRAASGDGLARQQIAAAAVASSSASDTSRSAARQPGHPRRDHRHPKPAPTSVSIDVLREITGAIRGHKAPREAQIRHRRASPPRSPMHRRHKASPARSASRSARAPLERCPTGSATISRSSGGGIKSTAGSRRSTGSRATPPRPGWPPPRPPSFRCHLIQIHSALRVISRWKRP